MPEQLKTLYKLMTMYTLSRVDFALTNSQITNLCLDLGYTNYFNVQYTLGDLVSSGLVHEEIFPDYRYYLLTDEGREALEALKNSIAVSIRSDIDTYLQANRLEFREALATRSEYYRTTEGDYAVRCRAHRPHTHSPQRDAGKDRFKGMERKEPGCIRICNAHPDSARSY